MIASAATYALRHRLTLRPLDGGKDGEVFDTDRPSVLKLHYGAVAYRRELACYVRLRDLEVERIVLDDGCRLHVPALLGWDDDLLALELTRVRPPFLLDFAGAQLDVPFGWSADVLDDWHARLREMHGDAGYARALSVIDAFESLGIYLQDLNPGNLRLSGCA